MATKWLDACGSATGGTEFLAAPTAGISAQTTVVNGQAYAYLMDTGAGPTAQQLRRDNVVVASTPAVSRCSRFVRFPAAPTGDTNVRLVYVSGAGGSLTSWFAVVLDSASKLRLYVNGVTTQAGATGSTVLSVDTWYRITLSFTASATTNWSAKVYVDGALEMTRTNADATLPAITPNAVGTYVASGAGSNWKLYVSDIYIDDVGDQSDPGNVHVTAKLPTTTTTNNFDTLVGTGAVNERPVSTANGKTHAATTDVDQDYEIQAASAGDVDISSATIVDSMAWVWAALGSATGTPTSKIIANGARTATTFDPNSTTTTLGTSVIGSASYPQNANGKNIGLSSTTIAADISLYDCGVVVAYIPSTGGPTTFPSQRLPLLGVG